MNYLEALNYGNSILKIGNIKSHVIDSELLLSKVLDIPREQILINLKKGDNISQHKLIRQFTELQYKRNNLNFSRGTFRVRGDVVEIFPAHYENAAWRINFFGDESNKKRQFNKIEILKKNIKNLKIFLVIAGTNTSQIPGISAAGINAKSRRTTALADAEFLLLANLCQKREL